MRMCTKLNCIYVLDKVAVFLIMKLEENWPSCVKPASHESYPLSKSKLVPLDSADISPHVGDFTEFYGSFNFSSHIKMFETREKVVRGIKLSKINQHTVSYRLS